MNAEEILKYHKLKNTGCRKFIITALLQKDLALSENEIKQSLPDLFDRVTFYRSLKTLEEYKIIHRIVLHDAVVKYALNREILPEGDHAHFHCVKCDSVTCLETKLKSPTSLPDGFSVNSIDVLLEGTCPECKGK
ncbi:transcriptional repressor [Dysgonomonas sp. Marseille-P4677]|uniref:Fur family transcriptional regulator n=1 Tax=Dysgonomonas sp. Marseille-P4677 TaxID=2364790 RepID=UPI00191482F4|nr:transcriptional repressor [Dysgonomonas sp. Marseille-P4677]MBK5720569.1 transcriptional repressor [Dysgonomonas sp. Marseille-P4677]